MINIIGILLIAILAIVFVWAVLITIEQIRFDREMKELEAKWEEEKRILQKMFRPDFPENSSWKRIISKRSKK